MIYKEVVTIAPKRSGQKTRLICETPIGNKWFVLTKNWKIVLKEQVGRGEFIGEEVMTIPFDRGRGSFRFTFDLFPERDKPKSEDIDDFQWRNDRELETDKKRAAFDFFAKHMQIEPVGIKNPYLKGEAMFIMDFVNHRTINNCLNSDKKVSVYNKVNAMTMQEKTDLALYFMPSLYGKRHSEIKEKLINLETGLLLMPNYLDDALKYDPTELSTAMRTYINKAIQLNILSQGQNGYYMHGTVYVGSNEHEAVGYFLKDAESYNNVIVKQVNAANQLPEDDLTFTNPDLSERIAIMTDYQRNKNQESGEWQAKFNMMREEARAMGIKNVEQKNYTLLSDEIDRVKRGDHKYLKANVKKEKDAEAKTLAMPK